MLLFFILQAFLFLPACNKTSDNDTKVNTEQDSKKEFGWSDDISPAVIPDFPVKGYMVGKEVQFTYVNYERWRGSGDNVINFSVNKPEQNCGFIENFEGFILINKGGEFKQGQWVKAKFADEPGSYSANFKTAGTTSTENWNCALVIDSFGEKTVKGRIALFFDDGSKSWAAGTFEAVICNN